MAGRQHHARQRLQRGDEAGGFGLDQHRREKVELLARQAAADHEAPVLLPGRKSQRRKKAA